MTAPHLAYYSTCLIVALNRPYVPSIGRLFSRYQHTSSKCRLWTMRVPAAAPQPTSSCKKAHSMALWVSKDDAACAECVAC